MLFVRRGPPRVRQTHSPGRVASAGALAEGLFDGLGFDRARLSANPQVTIAGATRQGSAAGLQLEKLSGSSSGAQLPLVAWNGAIAQVTGLLHVTSQNGEMIWEHSATADSNSGFYLYGLSASTLGIRSNATGASAATASFSYTFPSRPVVITMRLDCTINPHNYEFWAEGVLINSGGIPVTAGTYATNTLNIGCRNGSSLSSDGAFGPIFLHRKWTDSSALKEWHKNILLAYNRQRKRFPIGGASGSPYTLTAEAGSIALTGIDVGLAAARKITAEAGSIALTGQDVGLTAARKLLADTGAIVLTGQDVALIYTAAGAYTLAAGAGSFALTGQDAGLTAARRVALEAGAFTLTGVDVGLVYAATGSYTLTAAAGQFVLTGQNVTLDYFSVVRAARARATGSITESNQRPTAAAPRRSSGSAPSRPSRRS